ncbi:MAG TPA: proline racemase family protein [Hypericibacter adhaerens]|jgi:trans-L-3-hydroxyproline dehydratase|uniref:proline racemase family protein n=1 Tax=Hypericibacter adhaerens TaxID=2602016 RepID=UPI002C748975|nr:proline racemase family protein [Hypericibacter adhaerens]HWA45139.1 proline racemase family protein [Hypericibacter adhaerens]
MADPLAIETVEMHTGGEPVRLVLKGYPPIPGDTILAKRRYARERLDHLRKMLIFEPRGHFDMYGVIPVEPDLPEADLAVLFMHNEGYSTMCGHAVIALGRWAVESGRVKRAATGETPVNIQCPCGLVRAWVAADGAVRFESVPAFAFALDARVELPGSGRIALDIGYGGAFYAVLPAERVGLSLPGSSLRDLVDAAARVTAAVKQQIALSHPDDPDLAFLYGTIFTDGGDGAEKPSLNVCVFAEREVDRSPTGSGVTARMALQAARKTAGPGELRRFQSLTGAVFTGRALGRAQAGAFPAVRVEVGGRAHFSGTARFSLEPGDEIGRGFLLG